MSTDISNLIPVNKKLIPKIINARTHGIIDYCHAAFFLTLGFILLKSNKRAAAGALTTGSIVLVQSLLTDYPLGIKPVISFETHGKLDAAFAAVSFFVPDIFRFPYTKSANVFVSNMFVESTVVALTDFSSIRARAGDVLDTL